MKITSDYNKQKEIYEGGATSEGIADKPLGSDELGF